MQGYSSSEDSSPEDSDVIADVIDKRNIVDVIDLTATNQEGSCYDRNSLAKLRINELSVCE
jgi:hypothetical protein